MIYICNDHFSIWFISHFCLRRYFTSFNARLQALGDIQIAMKILSSDGDKGKEKEHILDRHYRELKCELSLIDSEEDKFCLVEKYMRQTHAATHNQYSLKLLDLFEVHKDTEQEGFKDVGNRCVRV